MSGGNKFMIVHLCQQVQTQLLKKSVPNPAYSKNSRTLEQKNIININYLLFLFFLRTFFTEMNTLVNVLSCSTFSLQIVKFQKFLEQHPTAL